MILKRVFSALTKNQKMFSLHPRSLYLMSNNKDTDMSIGKDDDFNFDFENPVDSKPRIMRYQNFRSQSNFGSTFKSSELLAANDLRHLMQLIEEEKPIHLKSESFQFIQHALTLFKKASFQDILYFKKSAMAGELINKTLKILATADKPYLNVMAFEFLESNLKLQNNISSWKIDSDIIDLTQNKIESLIKNEFLNDSELLKCLKVSVFLGNNTCFFIYKSLSDSINKVEELNYTQLRALIYLICKFNFSYKRNKWLAKISKNSDMLLKTNINAIVDLQKVLKNRFTEMESKELTKKIENIIIDKFDANDYSVQSIFRIIAEFEPNQLHKLLKFVYATASKIITENPEKINMNDITNICIAVTKHGNGKYTAKLIEDLTDAVNKNIQLFSTKIEGVLSENVINSCRAENTAKNIKNIFENAIINNLKNAIEKEKYIKSSLLFFVNKNTLADFLRHVAENKDKVSVNILNQILIISAIKEIEIPEVLSENLQTALQSPNEIREVISKSFLNKNPKLENFYEITKNEKHNFKNALVYTYVFPDHTSEIFDMKDIKKIFRNFDKTVNIPLNDQMITEIFNYFSQTIEKKILMIDLIRFDRFLNDNEFVKIFKKNNPKQFANNMSQLVRSYQIDTDSNKGHGNMQALINILTNAIDFEVLCSYSFLSVKSMIDQILDISIEKEKINNTTLLRKVNDLLFKASSKIDAAYINNLFSVNMPVNQMYKIIDHAFVSYQSYIVNGKVEDLDKIYNQYFESLAINDISYHKFKTALKLLNKQDDELISKFGDINLSKIFSWNSTMELFMIMLHRYDLFKDDKLINHVLSSLENIENIKINRMYLPQIFTIYAKNFDQLSKNEKVSELCEQIYSNISINNLLRKHKSYYSSILFYMVITNKPLDNVIHDKGIDFKNKIRIFKYLTAHDKQLELRNEILKNYTKPCLKMLVKNLELLIEKILIPMEDNELLDNIYSSLENDEFDLNTNFKNNKYSLMWLGINKPKVLNNLIKNTDITLNENVKPPYHLEFMQEILQILGEKGDLKPIFDGLPMYGLILEDKIILRDNYKSEIKDKILDNLYPNKPVLNMKFSELKQLTTVDKLENYIRTNLIYKNEFTDEQRAAIEELLDRRMSQKLQETEELTDNIENDIFEEEKEDDYEPIEEEKSPTLEDFDDEKNNK